MFVCRNRLLVLKGHCSVEEFAYVAADIVFDGEFATGVLVHKCGNIEDQVVQND